MASQVTAEVERRLQDRLSPGMQPPSPGRARQAAMQADIRELMSRAAAFEEALQRTQSREARSPRSPPATDMLQVDIRELRSTVLETRARLADQGNELEGLRGSLAREIEGNLDALRAELRASKEERREELVLPLRDAAALRDLQREVKAISASVDSNRDTMSDTASDLEARLVLLEENGGKAGQGDKPTGDSPTGTAPDSTVVRRLTRQVDTAAERGRAAQKEAGEAKEGVEELRRDLQRMKETMDAERSVQQLAMRAGRTRDTPPLPLPLRTRPSDYASSADDARGTSDEAGGATSGAESRTTRPRRSYPRTSSSMVSEQEDPQLEKRMEDVEADLDDLTTWVKDTLEPAVAELQDSTSTLATRVIRLEGSRQEDSRFEASPVDGSRVETLPVEGSPPRAPPSPPRAPPSPRRAPPQSAPPPVATEPQQQPAAAAICAAAAAAATAAPPAPPPVEREEVTAATASQWFLSVLQDIQEARQQNDTFEQQSILGSQTTTYSQIPSEASVTAVSEAIRQEAIQRLDPDFNISAMSSAGGGSPAGTWEGRQVGAAGSYPPF